VSLIAVLEAVVVPAWAAALRLLGRT